MFLQRYSDYFEPAALRQSETTSSVGDRSSNSVPGGPEACKAAQGILHSLQGSSSHQVEERQVQNCTLLQEQSARVFYLRVNSPSSLFVLHSFFSFRQKNTTFIEKELI